MYCVSVRRGIETLLSSSPDMRYFSWNHTSPLSLNATSLTDLARGFSYLRLKTRVSLLPLRYFTSMDECSSIAPVLKVENEVAAQKIVARRTTLALIMLVKPPKRIR